jgi:malate synthase
MQDATGTAQVDLARGAPPEGELLTPRALSFLDGLQTVHNPIRRILLSARRSRQDLIDAGAFPDFSEETAHVRAGDWTVAPAPAGLRRRVVELAAPARARTILDGLGSGADVLVADFDDMLSPTWDNLVEAQLALCDRWSAAGLASHPVASSPALMVRPRGLHLEDERLVVAGRPVAACIFDAGLYLFHNAASIVAAGGVPALYVSKLESRREAMFWDALLGDIENRLGLEQGTVKVTVSIETLPAAFEMDEILHAMRSRILGLQSGRASFLFSFIKRLRGHKRFLTPDRSSMMMGANVLASYPLLLVQTCHRRGAFAIGNLAAMLPVSSDHRANDVGLGKLRADKEREASDGYDGTWVGRASQVQVARSVFQNHGVVDNQLAVLRDDVDVIASDLLSIHPGRRTESGLRDTVRIALDYIEAWLRGEGALERHGMLEDGGSAELARAQLWQWVHHGALLSDGRPITADLVLATIDDEVSRLQAELQQDYARRRFADAAERVQAAVLAPEFQEFLVGGSA